jgi:hypothetical protein
LRYIQFLNRINKKNAGDLWSSPLRYFSFGRHSCRSLCIHRLYTSQTYNVDQPIIIGGGGLLYWEDKLRHIVESAKQKIVVWGMGVNRHGVEANDRPPSFLSKIDLLGIRDAIDGYRLVPCVSCLHPYFESKRIAGQGVRILEHYEHPLSVEGIPSMTNKNSIGTILRFLDDAEYVVSNSYHGIYWATLLGKKVLSIPLERSSRFYFLPHKPKQTEIAHLFKDLDKTVSYPDAYDRCREINIQYAAEVASLLDVTVVRRAPSLWWRLFV